MEQPNELMPGISINPRTMETDQGPVEYDLTEGNGPVVISCHGGIGGVDQARVMAAWIDTSLYRVLSVSRPGYLGTPLESGPTLDGQADLFTALLDKLGIDKAAVISASAGGPPAYTLAMRHPDRIWALVAIDSVSGYYDLPETAGAIAQAIFTTNLGQKFLKKLGEWHPELFLKQIFEAEAYFTKAQLEEHMNYALGSEATKAFVTAFMNTMNPYKPRKAGTENDMAIYRKLYHLPLEKVSCPSLIVHGTHDADVKFYDGVYAYENIPGAERFWIEEGSHLGFWISKNGRAAQDATLAFLNRHKP